MLILEIRLTDEGFYDNVDLQALIGTTIITRTFDGTKFEEKGYQEVVTLSSDIIYPNRLDFITLEKSISETEIDFFKSRWIDSTPFKGQSYTNY